uniref:Secreted protein n=1 Tax=Achlya hypogyna TaxID=1202772 RepID=A0A0A7CNW0_ACHHY|nr:secreted protein [Achlya hypogyna]
MTSLLLLCIVPFFLVQIISVDSEQSAFARSHNSHVRTPAPPLTVPKYEASVFQANHTPRFPDATRGIVMTLHNNMAALGISLIQELRRLGNRLPIQVYHCFTGELLEATRNLLRQTDPLDLVEIVDVCPVLLQNGVFATHWSALDYQSYLLKVVALLHTSFDEVMLLDADAIFLQNPDVLWSIDAYRRTGTLFFFDRQIDFKLFFNSPAPGGRTLLRHLYVHFPYEAFGLRMPGVSPQLRTSRAWQGATAHEQDSSVVLVRKSQVPPVVFQVMWHLVHYLRTDRVFKAGLSWYVRIVDASQRRKPSGDKEYFWLAFMLADAPYEFSPYAAADVALPEDMVRHPDTLCGNMAHYLPVPDEAKAVLLYVNGNDLLAPYFRAGDLRPLADNATWAEKEAFLVERIPAHVTPRRTERSYEPDRTGFHEACLIHQGAVPIDDPTFRPRVDQRIRETIAAARLVQTKPPNNWVPVARVAA